MRADAVAREPALQERCTTALYHWQRGARSQARRWVLHDGPPYANGKIHIGHALNKILKDVINRYMLLRGCQVEFIPGWDCHGLPIEMKAMEGVSREELRALDSCTVRERARQHAAATIVEQQQDFMRLGVLADWENAYTTMQPGYEAAQIGAFQQLVQKGYVHRRLKPVYWSPSSRTALAEAELEYPDDHVSQAAYVALPVAKLGAAMPQEALGASVMVWTTTPWTLPANVALAYGEDLEYAVVEGAGRRYIVASDCVDDVASTTGMPLQVVASFSSAALEGTECLHPTRSNMWSPLIPAGHVTAAAGTGLVHTAPGHGVEDFQACSGRGLPMLCPVDADGRYTEEVDDEQLQGLAVLGKGNEVVLEKLRSSDYLVHSYRHPHRYPYDWRTKKPVILRATAQWFINLESLKDDAVEALRDVQFTPPAGSARLHGMLGTRNEWCISRQRVWGTPLPAFYRDEEVLMDPEVISHVQSLVHQFGTDCWWNLSSDELLPEKYRGQGWERGGDTLDIWLDSGISWSAALGTRGIEAPADIYFEGSDQHRGWFQSSLLTATALTGSAPYRHVVTHGFVLDEKGRKMSKSLGNIVDPALVVLGGTNQKKNPPYGADVLRLWAASTEYTRDATIGQGILKSTAEAYRKIRNCSRFILGNLNDFDATQDAVPYEELPSVDRFMLHRLAIWHDEVTAQYDTLAMSKVYQSLVGFVAKDLSAFYFEVTKDRLYADGQDSHSRRSAQTVLHTVLDTLNMSLAPILCHLAEDIEQHRVGGSAPLDDNSDNRHFSVFQKEWIVQDPRWRDHDLAALWESALAVRTEVNRGLERLRADKTLAASAARVVLSTEASSPLGAQLAALGPDALARLCLTAAVELRSLDAQADSAQLLSHDCIVSGRGDESNRLVVDIYDSRFQKCARCWQYAIGPGEAQDICTRCAIVLTKL